VWEEDPYHSCPGFLLDIPGREFLSKSARFISIEGVEGVGKTTNLKFISEFFSQSGIPLYCTREPGGTPLAEQIRHLLLHNDSEKIDQMTELLLMFAARAQHVAHVIQPALERGEWVLCDRFTDSSFAYQGGGRGIAMETIEGLESLALKNFKPDYTIILDLPVSLGLERARTRSEKDRFEQEDLAFFERVRAVFLDRARVNPDRYCIIDTTQPLEEVQAELHRVLSRYVLNS
jgi:dTMP kinase